MMVFQMTAAATDINAAHPNLWWFFFLQKRCISENMVYLYKLSLIIVRIILALYMVCLVLVS